MKSIFAKSLLVAGILGVSQAAMADRILGVHGEVTYWQPSLSGSWQGNSSVQFGDENIEEAKGVGYKLAFEHFVPMVPNIKVSSYPYADDVLDQSGGMDVETDFDVVETDVVAYYQILDGLAWLSLDVGAGVKYIQGDFEVGADSDSLEEVLPVVNIAARADLPFSGFYAGAEYTKGLDIDDKQSDSMDAYVAYQLENFALDVGVKVGYRYSSYDLELDPEVMDVEAEGAYIGLTAHF